MKKYISLLILVFVTMLSSAQETKSYLSIDEQWALYSKASVKSDSLLSVEPFRQLLNSDQITLDNIKANIRFLIQRNQIYYLVDYYGFYDRKVKKDSAQYLEDFREVLELTDSLILQADCLNKTIFRYYKYKLLRHSIRDYKGFVDEDIRSQLAIEKDRIHLRWLIPEREGIGVGLEYQKGKGKSLGISVSPISIYIPFLSYADSCNEQGNTFKPYNDSHTLSVNLFTFAYTRAFDYKINEFSFSLVEVNAPYAIVPARFGFQFQEGVKHPKYYFRPSVGFGLGPFTISYAYNFMLNKMDRGQAEKHLFSLKFNIPVINYKYMRGMN